jgi:hypothetical protein
MFSVMLSPVYAVCHLNRYSEFHDAKCHYAECHYAECHYAECQYAECHDPFSLPLNTSKNNILKLAFYKAPRQSA